MEPVVATACESPQIARRGNRKNRQNRCRSLRFQCGRFADPREFPWNSRRDKRNLSPKIRVGLRQERLLRLLQARPRDPRAENAELCLVLEEAHSLVPEWNSTANDAEQQATNGTVRAVLQGRKYGFGCLLITQRTANVTKSILNQCNTIFGMRIFDARGMGFLENYVGPTYAHLLASLRERQAVVFGRASSCNSPLIVDLNDTDSFNRVFWEPRRGTVPVTEPPKEDDPEEGAGDAGADDSENDIPF
jgi:DNA helicase HerA-like ATPase